MLNKDKLYKKQFLGQYGRINSIIFKISKTNKTKKTIVKFDTINQAALSIISLNNFNIGKNKIEVKFNIKKYCNYFLNNKKCFNSNCLFIHEKIENNNYVFCKIKNNEIIDSHKFALEILNVTKKQFDEVHNKLIGDNYFQINKKFPKMTIKKLKGDYYKKFPLNKEIKYNFNNNFYFFLNSNKKK